MDPVILPAHFDGRHIQLDQPYELKRDARLLVTVLPALRASEEDESSLELSRLGLAAAYGPDEPEYSLDLLKEENSEYEGR